MNQREMPVFQPLPIRTKYVRSRWHKFFQSREYILKKQFILPIRIGVLRIPAGFRFKKPLLDVFLIPHLFRLYYYERSSYRKSADKQFYIISGIVNGKHFMNWLVWKWVRLTGWLKYNKINKKEK